MDEAERKRIFFDKLYACDSEQDDENEEEPESVRSFLENSNRSYPQNTASSQQVSAASSSSSNTHIQAVRTPAFTTKPITLVRSTSAPTSATKNSSVVKETPLPLLRRRFRVDQKGTPLATEVSFVEETPIMARGADSMRVFSSPVGGKKTAAKATGALGKRKRDAKELDMVSEKKRIFNGMRFFYLPNDDIAPVRKIRIKKAREHGALWMREYNEEVSHLIVDNDLTYEDVAKYLKLSQIPQTIIVNEDWPVECMAYGILLDATQKQHFIRGYQQAVEIPAEKPLSPLKTSDNPAESLQQEPAPSKIPPSPNGTPSHSPSSRQQRRSSISQDLTSATKHGDMLDQIIQETKKLEHFLPGLDDDEKLKSTEASPEEEDSADGYSSAEEKPKPSRKRKRPSGATGEENFACMTGGTGEITVNNPNTATIEILQQMANYYDRMNDHWRISAYRRAITTLKKEKNKITRYEEAISLPFIGDRLAEKIEEIARTRRLRRLDNIALEPADLVLQQFMNIYGVGYGIASKWIAQGYRTFEDLLTKARLTDGQKLGIKRYDDFLTRIPRKEVTALGDIIKETARDIDPEVEIIIGGSYRRGAEDSGDIDLIVTKPGANIVQLNPFLTKLVAILQKKSFLVASLAVSGSESGSKWHGCCVLPGQEKPIWRRIDFLLVPDNELGAALIYFTGDDIFNRSIRLLAGRKGMRLNQRGLYRDCMRGPGRVKITDGELVEGKDEKRIFEILGVPWRKPEDRIC